MFPIKSVAVRNQQRRPRRPNRIYDAHPRPHRSNQRAQSSPQVWTTPASDLENQTITQFISQLSAESIQAPPTYNEAIGRQVFTEHVQPNLVDHF